MRVGCYSVASLGRLAREKKSQRSVTSETQHARTHAAHGVTYRRVVFNGAYHKAKVKKSFVRVARASRRYARRVASNAARWIHEIASKTPRRTAETNRDVAFVAVNDANAKF